MLVFIDESGDPGFKFDKGSSRYFTIALVVFEDRENAIACDRRIELLRWELGWKGEFHFYRNSDNLRRDFLHAVSPYHFFYYGIVIDKERQRHMAKQYSSKWSFYHYVCGLVFESAKDKLLNATVVIDASGNFAFRRELALHLRRVMNTGTIKRISKVKMQRSGSNNLIQLADYVVGIINRSVQHKKNSDVYRKIIYHREIDVRVWPPMSQ